MSSSQNEDQAGLAPDAYNERPDFIAKEELRRIWTCQLCSDVVMQCMITCCGNRVCLSCINEKFGQSKIIFPCPFKDGTHDFKCNDGLQHSLINYDPEPFNTLKKEKVFCSNKNFGCDQLPKWRRLNDHLAVCEFKAVKCIMDGCTESVAAKYIEEHVKKNCAFALFTCNNCRTPVSRRNYAEHIMECEQANPVCCKCSKIFKNRKEVLLHQHININCFQVTEKGPCLICESVRAGNTPSKYYTPAELLEHLQDSSQQHSDIMLIKCYTVEKNYEDMKAEVLEEYKAYTEKTYDSILKTLATASMNVVKVKQGVKAFQSKMLVMGQVSTILSAEKSKTDTLLEKVEYVIDIICKKGVDKAAINALSDYQDQVAWSQINITRNESLMDLIGYDGEILFKIDNYKQMILKAKRSSLSFRSYCCFSELRGHKFYLLVYLNGIDSGLNEYISVAGGFEKSDYDEFNEWPFPHGVEFYIKTKTNSFSSHTQSDGSVAWNRPEENSTEVFTIEQFISHSLVEEQFIVNNCIYVGMKIHMKNDKANMKRPGPGAALKADRQPQHQPDEALI